MATRLNPYIAFKDNAREAMEFYKSVFGGKLDMGTYDSIPGNPHGPDEAKHIMHAMLVTDSGLVLMGSDTPSSLEYNPGARISVSLSGEDESEIKGYWDKLSAGGTVIMPFEKAPWGDTFGMLTDKYGIQWMINLNANK